MRPRSWAGRWKALAHEMRVRWMDCDRDAIVRLRNDLIAAWQENDRMRSEAAKPWPKNYISECDLCPAERPIARMRCADCEKRKGIHPVDVSEDAKQRLAEAAACEHPMDRRRGEPQSIWCAVCGACWYSDVPSEGLSRARWHDCDVTRGSASAQPVVTAARALIAALPRPWTALEACRELASLVGLTESDLARHGRPEAKQDECAEAIAVAADATWNAAIDACVSEVLKFQDEHWLALVPRLRALHEPGRESPQSTKDRIWEGLKGEREDLERSAPRPCPGCDGGGRYMGDDGNERMCTSCPSSSYDHRATGAGGGDEDGYDARPLIDAVRRETIEACAKLFESPLGWKCLDHGGEEASAAARTIRESAAPFTRPGGGT